MSSCLLLYTNLLLINTDNFEDYNWNKSNYDIIADSLHLLQEIASETWKVNVFFKPMIKTLTLIRIWRNASVLKNIILHIFLFSNKSYATLAIFLMMATFFVHLLYISVSYSNFLRSL